LEKPSKQIPEIIPDTSLRKIEQVVRNCCEENNLTPKDFRLVIPLAIESEFSLNALSGSNTILTLLKQNPLTLQERDNGYNRRISGFLEQCEFTSMYVFMTQKSKKIMMYRNIGPESKFIYLISYFYKTDNT
jgi:hypothetical protein